METWSAKIEEEKKLKLQDLIESSGLSSKDFLESMMNTYELQASKEKVYEIAQDITEFQQLTQRMNHILIGVSERIVSMKNTAEFEKQSSISEKENIISALTEQLKSREHQIKTSNDTLAIISEKCDKLETEYQGAKDHFDKEVHRLEVSTANDQDLIKQFKEKVESLSNMLMINQDKAQLYDKLINEHTQLLSNFDQSTKQIESLTKSHETEIKNLHEKKDIEIANVLLTAEKEFNTKLQAMSEMYNNKLYSLLNSEKTHPEKNSQNTKAQTKLKENKPEE